MGLADRLTAFYTLWKTAGNCPAPGFRMSYGLKLQAFRFRDAKLLQVFADRFPEFGEHFGVVIL